ncbi:MAG: hypothetical protein SVT56_05250 [Chloroflexota bacterium]|nr:hypothetical protein [Chloroflexota bacterium]
MNGKVAHSAEAKRNAHRVLDEVFLFLPHQSAPQTASPLPLRGLRRFAP